LLLAVARHVVKALQPLLIPLLTRLGKPPELRIILKRPALLVQRLLAMLI
jgi:hypothetical protein